MRDSNESKGAMYGAVMLNLNDNAAIWQGVPYIAATVTAISNIIKAIDKARLIKLNNITGVAMDKKDRRLMLEESASLVVSIMRSYATYIKNDVLFEQVHFTPSMLKNSRENDLLVNTGTLFSIGTEYLSGAASFGMTQDFLDDLNNKHTDFANWITAPADAIKIKKDATSALKKLYAEADALLKNNLDNDLILFKKSHPDFYKIHFALRKIKHSPTTKLAMRCKITDAETEQPLMGARVVIKDHDVNRKSTAKGQILVRNLKDGNHTVTVSMKGYITQAVQVTYKSGETTQATIAMVR